MCIRDSYNTVIVLWSDIARFEALDMRVNIQYATDRDGKAKTKEGEINPETNLDFRWNNPWIQLSPARLDVHPYRLKQDEMNVFYNKIYTGEAGLLDTLFYMKDVYNTCDALGIRSHGGAFHQGVRFNIKRMFNPNRHQMLGLRLERIQELAEGMISGFNKTQLIGLEGSKLKSFNEFTEEGNYKKMPEGHPGPEAHKQYAQYLYEELEL